MGVQYPEHERCSGATLDLGAQGGQIDSNNVDLFALLEVYIA